MDRVDELQVKYDRLVKDRAIAIEMYNSSRDGSQQKQTALEVMDRLGTKIHEVEDDIEDAVADFERGESRRV